MISVIVLTRNRPRLLAECLDSLEAAGAPDRAEVVVGINGGTRAEAESLAASHPWIVIVLLDRVPRGRGRNELVSVSRGDDLFFLDDDAAVAADFFDRLEEMLGRHPGAAVLGGPNLLPEGSSRFQRAADFLLRSPLGAGPMRRRYVPLGPEAPRGDDAFMLSGLLVRRAVFSRGLSFDPACSSAEENLLIHDLAAAFGPGIYCPGLAIRHHRRDGWRAFLSQVFVNGRGRGEITRMRPASFHPAALGPVSLLAAGAAAVAGSTAAQVVVAAYAAAVLGETCRMLVFEESGAPAAWRLPFLFPSAHAAYALGVITGLARGGR
jgi:glycosyltransferase involved in cell wall biosynthesis